MNKLVIIDGKSVFYRGYYAMGNLSRADGTPTSGVYGFATIAMEIVRKLSPTKVVVAWDKAHTSTAKRTKIYPEYKAGRVKPPEDFYAQIPLLKDLIKALGWGFLEADEYEADDIIGTLAKQADDDLDEDGICKWETYIVSSDLDMLQIVDDNTKMYRLLKGFSSLEELDVPAVEEKYGIKKSQFLDLKSLKGDNSDNIPGVPGIGEKGAATLLNTYGTLDGIYEHINEIKGATQKKLIAGKESAYMSKQLAEIMFDAPVSLSEVPDLVINKTEIISALKNLEFFSLVRKYSAELDKLDPVSAKARHEDVKSRIEALMGKVQEAKTISEIDATPFEVEIPKDLIIARDVKTAMHADAKFAEKILSGEKYWDISQAEFLLNPLSRKENDEQLGLSFNEDNEGDYKHEVSEFRKYPKLKEVYETLDLPMIPVLYKMEKTGVKIDREHFKKLEIEFSKKVTEIEKKIHALAGLEFNVNSPIQLSDVLFTKLELPTKGIKKTSRGYSTGAKELEKLEGTHEIIPLIEEYRENAKLLSTYILPLPTLADETDSIHTTFTQNVTATGRLSSVNPNLQNIPVRTEIGKEIRKGFVARKGKTFISADYSQFELRLAAVLSGDQKLIENFNSGVDIHTKTASEVFNIPMDAVTKDQRRAAKVINFGVMYGMSPKGLADAAGMSFYEAKEFIDDYFRVRSPIKDYLDQVLIQAKGQGYVETFFGRRRPTPDVKSSNFVIRMAAERAAQNMPIQGTEADLMKRVMIKLDHILPAGAQMILQIHDSIIIECDEDKAEMVSKMLQTEMENVAPELKIKLAVEVTTGKNWGDL
ncbi:DNA polymerase I [Candidatus Saccharibacteria bacterium]|nr:DNA polymerase I [Candidatus Saccharibacteria bacterium]